MSTTLTPMPGKQLWRITDQVRKRRRAVTAREELPKGETTIQREALPDLSSPGHQADPTREGCGDAESEGGSSLSDPTPPLEDFRGGPQGAGDETWVAGIARFTMNL